MSSRIAVIDGDSIRVTRALAIPLSEVQLRFSRSSGPGGQHAQKTETRVEAVFDVEASATLSEAQKRRLVERIGRTVRAVSQDERSQSRNRELALARLGEAIAAGLKLRRGRRPSKPPPEARERRLAEKRRRAETKRLREQPGEERTE
jgi:ribosome-associated protein